MDISEFKKLAQNLSFESLGFTDTGIGVRFIPESIGAGAGVIDFESQPFMFALANDGIGTKNKLAEILDAAYALEAKKRKKKDIFPAERTWSYYRWSGIDLVAMNANDLLCVGAVPIALLMDLSLAKKILDTLQFSEFLRGLERALKESGMWLAGGETADGSEDIIVNDSVNISGAAFGIIAPKTRLTLGDKKYCVEIILLRLSDSRSGK